MKKGLLVLLTLYLSSCTYTDGNRTYKMRLLSTNAVYIQSLHQGYSVGDTIMADVRLNNVTIQAEKAVIIDTLN